MMHTVPAVLLPKVRSPLIMDTIRGQMPCSLRIASFVGLSCAGMDTVCGCHLPVVGRGVATKATDLAVAAGCFHCHNILDGRNQNALEYIQIHYPGAYFERLLGALVETHARLYDLRIIRVPHSRAV
jgi:hypothetical protein